MTSIRTLLATVALAASIAAAQAQTTAPATTDTDHNAHHPAGTTATTPGAPPAATPGSVPMMGKMMGGGTGQMMSMMSMMRDGMMQGGGGMAVMPFDHVEGRLAFYKAELGITDAQLPQWNAFADALRGSAKGMRSAMTSMMQGGMPTTAPTRMEALVQMMSARLDAMKAMLAGTKSLYAVLSDDQKKTADELMAAHPMGMRTRGMGEL